MKKNLVFVLTVAALFAAVISCRRETPGRTVLIGGDISELTYVEQNGGKYYMDGKEMDCIELLKKGGFNIVRLRLYNDPGNPDFSPSCRLP
ncbi:MAG: glycosyl hydrolase 53 family protein, partial [Bacteroidales bacterium]|nr:glycosyl hydrolase 53 family protein [Bacteroidales bacterium]